MIPRRKLISRTHLAQVISKTKLSPEQQEQLRKRCKQKKISKPIVIRDWGERGSLYSTLIYRGAKRAPEEFGMRFSTMTNFNGIFIVDEDEYRRVVNGLKKKLRSSAAVRKIRQSKEQVNEQMRNLAKRMQKSKYPNASNQEISKAFSEFLSTRTEFTKSSFFADTMATAVEEMLDDDFKRGKQPPDSTTRMFVSDKKTMEQRLGIAREQIKKAAENGREPSKNPELAKLLDDYMAEFADTGFTNFTGTREQREKVLENILSEKTDTGFQARMNKMTRDAAGRKRAAAIRGYYALPEGSNREEIIYLSELAGDLSKWESENRQIWTRVHREAKELLGEIGKRAEKQGILENSNRIFDLPVGDIVKIVRRITK